MSNELPRRRHVLPPVLALLLAAVPLPVHADWLESTLMQPVEEVEHLVHGTVRDGVLYAHVRRSFVNAGDVADEVVMGLDVPAGASAVGLRLRAGGKWHEGELLDADEAGDRYQTLTGLGVAQPRDPVLLQWSSTSQLLMQVFPVFAGGARATVEYDLAVPLDWEASAYRVAWPLPDGEAGLAAVRFDVEVDAEGGGGHAAVTVENGVLHMRPRHRGEVVARLGSAAAGEEGAFARLQVEAPARLSELPRAPSVVFVVDGSWSVTEERLQAQLALARGWLEHTPDARFEVVVFSREARELAGRLRPASEATRWLQAAQIPRANGSEVSVGLRRGLAVLAAAPAPRRLILFSDALLASSGAVAAAKSALRAAPGQLVVHVVIPTAGEAEPPLRDDEHELAVLAHPSGGVLFHASAEGQEPIGELAAAVLPLVRPVQIDHLELIGLPDELRGPAPESLGEGEGFRLFDSVAEEPDEVTLQGQLWSSPWTLEVDPDPVHSVLTAGWAFAEGLTVALTREAQLRLARHARVVSPVTSYLAIEPGASPSTAGIPERAGGMGGIGMRGFGSSSCGIGHGVGYVHRPPERSLSEQAREALAACGAPAVSVRFDVETTRDEIVAIQTAGEPAIDAARHRCLEEALWAHRVDPGWARFERRQSVVQVAAAAP